MATPQADTRSGAGWLLRAVTLLFWDWRAGRIGRLTYLAASMNLAAKRFRDIGLPVCRSGCRCSA